MKKDFLTLPVAAVLFQILAFLLLIVTLRLPWYPSAVFVSTLAILLTFTNNKMRKWRPNEIRDFFINLGIAAFCFVYAMMSWHGFLLLWEMSNYYFWLSWVTEISFGIFSMVYAYKTVKRNMGKDNDPLGIRDEND